MHPLQWMGAVRMKVQTADKDITIIYTTPVQQLMWLWSILAWSNGLTYGLEWCGLCDAVWTLILTAPIHCPLVSKWSNATFLQICSAEETSSSPSWVAWGWISFKVLLVNFHLKTSVLILFNTESKDMRLPLYNLQLASQSFAANLPKKHDTGILNPSNWWRTSQGNTF